MHFYQHSPTFLGAYCNIVRENFIVCSKLLLLCLITLLDIVNMDEEQLKICNQSCFIHAFV